MLRKYALIASVLVAFGMPFDACAQTTRDVAMKIQVILDYFSQIRSDMKQAQSSTEIEKMLENLNGSSSWKDKLRNAIGGIFDRNAKKGGASQSFLVVPDGLAGLVDDPEKAMDWLKNNITITKDTTSEEIDEIRKKRAEMQSAALLSGYGKAVAIRKQLDKDLALIDKLKQEAESKNTETDLQNEINQLALLELEQINYQQLLETTRSYIDGMNDSIDIIVNEEDFEE